MPGHSTTEEQPEEGVDTSRENEVVQGIRRSWLDDIESGSDSEDLGEHPRRR